MWTILPKICAKNLTTTVGARKNNKMPKGNCLVADSGQIFIFECSDITNTLVGISGETVPEGRNLCIY